MFLIISIIIFTLVFFSILIGWLLVLLVQCVWGEGWLTCFILIIVEHSDKSYAAPNLFVNMTHVVTLSKSNKQVHSRGWIDSCTGVCMFNFILSRC